MTRVVLAMIGAYQRFLSLDTGWLGRVLPHQGSVCRYEPTCSEYTKQAIERFGIIKGSALGIRRVGRCHPWGGSGYDPVPEAV
jgi:putative membrane protein insertion efficiency factor